MKPVSKNELIYWRLGFSIMFHRKRMRMTQKTLSEKVKLSRGSVANIELGRQRILVHDVANFADALKTTPTKLIRGCW